MSSPATSVQDARDQLDRRIGGSPRLVLPEKFTFTNSWKRAQAAREVEIGPAEDAAHFDVCLGYADSHELGDRHRVLFCVENGALRAECSCKAWTFRDWCAHVAVLWWRWSRGRSGVTNLDTGEVLLERPWWLFVPIEGEEAPL